MSPDVFFTAQQIARYTSGTFRSGVPIRVPEGADPRAPAAAGDKLKEDWYKAHGGDRRSIAVLNAAVDFQAHLVLPRSTRPWAR